MYQVIKHGKLVGEFHFYAAALLVRELLQANELWFKDYHSCWRIK